MQKYTVKAIIYFCPVDIDEFSEYLGYNLSSIGVDSSTDEYFFIS